MTVRRCDPHTEREALRLATRAWPAAERTAYHEALRWLLASNQADRVALVAAQSGENFLAAQLAQVLPGKVAIIWQPVFADHQPAITPNIVRALFDAALAALAAAGAELAQAMIGPDNAAAGELFLTGGFTKAAELLYFTATAVDGSDGDLRLSFDLVPCRDGDMNRLARLIEQTYVGTLDCPSLDGLRSTADVIAGYRAVGQFRPELWFFVRAEGKDVGCFLLNVHPDEGHLEIVYLALVPSVRGQGWGCELACASRAIAWQQHCSRVVLAVDSVNTPATDMYEQAGFKSFDRRCVWIRTLSEKQS